VSIIRILILNSSLSHGGAERQISYLVNGLQGAGHEVHLAVMDPNVKIDETTHLVRWSGYFDPGYRKIVGLPPFVRRVRTLVRSLRPDIIHTWGPYENLVATIVGRLQGVPVIAGVRGIGAWQFKFARFWAHRATAVAVNAAQVKRRLLDELSIAPGRVWMIRNALDTNKYPVTVRVQELGKTVRITVVGRLSPVKNQILLVRALPGLNSAFPDVQFRVIFVGPEERNEYRVHLEQEARRLAVEKQIQLLPFTEDIQGIYSQTDILVLPSVAEGLPNVLLEAMATGVPWIATDIVDNRWLAGANQERGILFQSESVDGLIHAVQDVINTKPKALADRALRGREFVEREFAPERMTEEFSALYKQVLHARN
jgi:glycosyltransferase involved in cell wall biosynthesis